MAYILPILHFLTIININKGWQQHLSKVLLILNIWRFCVLMSLNCNNSCNCSAGKIGDCTPWITVLFNAVTQSQIIQNRTYIHWIWCVWDSFYPTVLVFCYSPVPSIWPVVLNTVGLNSPHPWVVLARTWKPYSVLWRNPVNVVCCSFVSVLDALPSSWRTKQRTYTIKDTFNIPRKETCKKNIPDTKTISVTRTSYISTVSPSTSVASLACGGSHAKDISVDLTDVTRTFMTLDGTEASVVTVIST